MGAKKCFRRCILPVNMLCSSQGYRLLLHQRNLPTKHKEQQGTTASIYIIYLFIYLFFLNQTSQASNFLPILPARSWSLTHTDTLLVFSTCQLGTSISLKSQLASYTTAPLQFNNPGNLSFLSLLIITDTTFLKSSTFLAETTGTGIHLQISLLQKAPGKSLNVRLKQTQATLKTLVSTNDNLFVFSSMNQNSNCHMA